MKKNSKNTASDPAELHSDVRDTFGFADEKDEWLDRLRDAVAPEPLGTIGAYEILEEVARGGQGIVYRARQPGAERQIALKRMVAGSFSTRDSRQRFEREVRVLSALRHPGIVTVYGVDFSDEFPSLAMEWVDGVPITQWAREGAAPRKHEDVVRSLLLVCDAVQHAHQRGVVHRDLKPSNILIDTDGLPRILDFGLAKLLEEPGHASLTRTGDFVGTPAYASPEQLDGANVVDTRGDVYSLGVILYEALTGRRPYRPEDGIREFMAALEREGFERPSKIDPAIRPDLDAIAQKALAPRPEARFQSVGDLGDDLRRYLAGEAVLAHPPSGWYRFNKFVTRQPALCTSVALLALSLIAGFAVALYQADVIAAERDALDVARKEAVAASEEAIREADRAAQVSDFLLNDIFLGATPTQSERQVTLVEVVDAAASRVGDRFPDRLELQLIIRLSLARLYEKFGRLDDAEREALHVCRLHSELDVEEEASLGIAEYLLGIVYSTQGRSEEAASKLADAIRRFESSGVQHPGWLIESHRLAALARLSLEDTAGAREHYRLGLEAIERFPIEPPYDRSMFLLGLALCEARSGNLAAARPAYEEALDHTRKAYGPDSERFASILGSIADLDQAEGKLSESKANSRASLAIYQRIYGTDHPKTVAAMGDLGDLLTEPDELAEGEQLLRQAVRISTSIRGADSLITKIHASRLAKTLRLTGRHEEAATILREALAVFSSAGPIGRRWTERSRLWLALAERDLEHWKTAGDLFLKLAGAAREKGDAATLTRALAQATRCLVRQDAAEAAAAALDELVRCEVEAHPNSSDRRELRETVDWLRAENATGLLRAAESRESALTSK